MKTLVALGIASLLGASLLTGSAALAQGSWPHPDGSAQNFGGSWQHSDGPHIQSSPSFEPHSSPSFQPHSQSWPHPSGSLLHSDTGPITHSSESWIHDHDHDGDHHDRHHRHRWGGGPPYFGWGAPDYGYDYDYGYDDGYYPEYSGDDYDAHVRWCQAHYKTYNPATDTFFIRRGVPARCVAPFD